MPSHSFWLILGCYLHHSGTEMTKQNYELLKQKDFPYLFPNWTTFIAKWRSTSEWRCMNPLVALQNDSDKLKHSHLMYFIYDPQKTTVK